MSGRKVSLRLLRLAAGSEVVFVVGGNILGADAGKPGQKAPAGQPQTTVLSQQVAVNGNGALQFDGLDDYVGIPDSPSLDPNNKTIECWVKPTELATAYEYVISKYKPNIPKGGYCLGLNTNGRFFAVVIGNESGAQINTVPGTYQANNWYHVVLVHDYDANTIKLYVNGVLKGINTNLVGYTPYHSTLCFGKSSYGNTGYFKGVIDDVRIYNVALNAEQVLKHFAAPGKPVAQGLVSWWKLDGTEKQTSAVDESEASNGTLYNFFLSPDSGWITR